jgi:TldD protein
VKRGPPLQFDFDTPRERHDDMISREPTIERLAIARALLLEPFGSTRRRWRARWRRSPTHRIDDADLYFQYTRSEGWSLEEGIVKSGSFGIDQGVGVRAVAGEKTAFAYSDDISERRCSTRRAPCARSPPPGRAAASRLRAARSSPAAACSYAPDGSDRHARQHAEGRAAREGRAAGARRDRASSR